jgi:hypothetical protein
MDEIKLDCPCPKNKCDRHGNCTKCEDHHGKKGKLPYCKRKNKNNPVPNLAHMP